MANNMSQLDANQPKIHDDTLILAINKNTRCSGPLSTAKITGNKKEFTNDLEEEDKGEVREMEDQGHSGLP